MYLLAELTDLDLRVELTIDESQLILMLVDHEVKFETAHAGHVLCHSFLVIDSLLNLHKFLLESEVVLQMILLVCIVITVKNSVHLPFYIVLMSLVSA